MGTNSLGWAVVDDEANKILGTGVRIFQEGVNNLGEGDREISKNASRSDLRGTRRQLFRRRVRKNVLLKLLIENDMCPLTNEQLLNWKKTNVFPEYELREWFAEKPYQLRAKATTEKISLHQLGRIFYHLIQRRGFQSNSRSQSADEGTIYKSPQ